MSMNNAKHSKENIKMTKVSRKLKLYFNLKNRKKNGIFERHVGGNVLFKTLSQTAEHGIVLIFG